MLQRIFLHCLTITLLIIYTISLQAKENTEKTPSTFASLPTNIYGRDSVDLSGVWQYIVDPMREGLLYPPKNIRNFAKDEIAQGNRLIEYEWNSSPTIHVPGDWNTQIKEMGWYEGLVWYRKKLVLQKKANKRYFVYFEGANYWKRVSINNEILGEHEGGFSPFFFEITEQVKAGENSLVVAVDNTRERHQIPSLKYDWFNYGGITRPVHILEVPENYIHNYRFFLQDDGNINVAVELSGENLSSGQISVSIPELGVNEIRKVPSKGRITFSITPKQLIRWSPEQPKLYDVHLKTDTDSITERIGFRTIKVVGPDILLNGKSVYMKGISVHEEKLGPYGGRGFDTSDARKLLALVKELGGNYVRLAHYPHSEEMLRLADEIGLMVWSEIPLWQELDFVDPRTLALAKKMQSENMDRDFNRASVVIWSVANETPQTPERLTFLKQLIDLTRETDSSRLISSALHKNKVDGNTITVEDPLGQYLDVYAVNTYEGWYGPRVPAQVQEVTWKSIYNKPMLFSEFGAGAKAEFHSAERKRWSEEYQEDIYRETLKLAEATPMLRGMSPWILKDFKSPRRYHGRFQNYWNRKGLVDEKGEKKLAFDVLKNWYENKPNYQEQKAAGTE